ncbi:uncharacterized protein DS421_16g546480 [Arachis hypogaea]|nr:uncharacterized protein DS421_16g546480 [Arachis hypogaea]
MELVLEKGEEWKERGSRGGVAAAQSSTAVGLHWNLSRGVGLCTETRGNVKGIEEKWRKREEKEKRGKREQVGDGGRRW